MTTSTKAAVLALAVVMTASASTAWAQAAMGEAVEFPHAGIALAMPAGYQVLSVGQPFDIVRAILTDNNQPVQAVTVAAFPLDDPSITAEQLADEMVAAQQQNLAIRNFQVLSKAAMKVAGRDGAARFISYTFRGEQTVAASVVFCRELADRKARLQYVITVEAAADRKAEVLPVLGDVVKSVRLLTLVRPIDIPVKPSTQLAEAPGGLYALRVPHGWFAQVGEGGISVAQTDYALAGESAVSACVLVADAPEASTPQQHAQQCIQAATRAAAEEGMEAEVIAHGPARLGNVEARQLVIEQRTPKATSAPTTAATSQPAPAAAPEPTTSTAPANASGSAEGEPNNVVIVQRSMLLPPAQEGSPARRLSLVLVCVDARPAAATAVMDKLAEGIVIRATPASAPATQPATGEAPATTAPSAQAGVEK